MKIQSIGIDDRNSCYLLDCDGIGVLLDFPLSFRLNNGENSHISSLENIKNCPIEYCLPCLDMVDMCSLQAVLISNVYSMIALPFLTERTKFKGKIYTTVPIFELGKLLMKDYIYNLHSSMTVIKQSTTEKQLNDPELFISGFYTECEMDSCLKKIDQVSFCDNKNLKIGVYVTAISSGHSFGSCNWLIQNNNEKVCYLSASSLFKTYAIPMQKQYMNDIDVLVVSQLAQCDVVHPDSLIQSIFDRILESIRNGGSVLFPIYPTGFIYDLVQFLYKFLDRESYSHIPMYCISPVITASLSYSNISVEWLTDERLENSCNGLMPFEHQNLIEKKRLICLNSMSDIGFQSIKRPCIIMASNPLLLCGPSRDLFNEWKNSTENCCIFTDPYYPMNIALEQFKNIDTKCFELAVDTRVSYFQLFNLCNELQPKIIILSSMDNSNFIQYITKSNNGEFKIDTNCIIGLELFSNYRSNKDINNDQYQNVYISGDLADEICIGSFGKHQLDHNDLTSLGCCFISCYIEEKNGKLRANTSSIHNISLSNVWSSICDNFHIYQFSDYLLQNNKKIISVDENNQKYSYRIKYKGDQYIDIDFSKIPIELTFSQDLSSKSSTKFTKILNHWLQSKCDIEI